MKPAVLRLVVCAVLFAGWIGYLALLVLTTRNPVVLSRPQFLVSEMVVIATHQAGDTFVIDDVLYAPKDRKLDKGATIVVKNLDHVQTFSPGAKDGWRTAAPPEGSKCLMPLELAGPPADAGTPVNVVPIPASPGFPPYAAAAGPPRVYPDDPAVIRQYQTIPKP